MIEKAIIQLLLQSLPLKAIVDTRIYPNIIKRAVYPAVFVAANRMNKVDCDADMGLKTGVVEIGVMGADYLKCLNAIIAIREKLDEYSGMVGNVGITFLNGEEAPDGYDENTEVHLKSIEFQAYARIKSST
ncbi:hypothetical protein MUK70_12795 [Dyadobacter chenwenxiniae]|uniref:DUF3168 domain-containing protein n=1 Tax=Dyadobacter chenwenxiniae TaxID=2906456 RepID=A0A9X1PGF2_9BACT|nr:hypothetical protein [Dyadobacter chenwenxiniae]MCF0060121.1 hypothetical protein [Dyadobacter chenwenxiniae]UON85859.1 hypothetical protein MUK70_12795 [Dyadobacter chenwenxiniae]